MKLFEWDARNRDHIAKHHVSPAEAEQVVIGAEPPYPMEVADQKLIVWGTTEAGRYLQVIFILRLPEEVEYDSLTMEQWMAVEADEVRRIIRVIHAMYLTEEMKRRLRRRKK